MILVACMAGLYKRFRDAGYTQPKYLLPVQGRPILAHVVGELLHDGVIEHVRLVANVRDRAFEGEVLAALGAFRVREAHVTWTGDTSGQAETAAIAARGLVAEGLGELPVVFHNVDTIVTGRDLRAIRGDLSLSAGYIDVFDADSPAYSFVRVEGDGVVTEIAEKRPISRLATSGLYGFASARAYLEDCGRSVANGEHYVSGVYARMLVDGARIVARPPPAGARTIVLGTPAEYELHRSLHG